MKRKEPARIAILQEIFEHFQQVTQWMPDVNSDAGYSDGVTSYLHKAEALIEVLEANDCGSVGGFDDGQTERGIYNRFLWLLNKYNKSEDIKPSCNFTPESLRKYFAEVGALRNKISGE